MFAGMSFRNFVVADGAKETSFLPKDPKEVSYGVGSPSVYVNNNDVDALAIEPISSAKPPKLEKSLAIEETTQLVENVVDSDDPPSDEEPVMIVGSSGIADRVRSRKGTEAKAIKANPKRKLLLPTPSSRTTRQKGPKGKAIQTVPQALDEDIHG